MTRVQAWITAIEDVQMRKHWKWWIEPADEDIHEVCWQAPGWPVGAVMIDMREGENVVRATVGYALRNYDASMRLKLGPPTDEEVA